MTSQGCAYERQIQRLLADPSVSADLDFFLTHVKLCAQCGNYARELQKLQRPSSGQQTIVDPVVHDAEPPTSFDRITLPPSIGRYRVEKKLGEGGFSNVYLAHDDDLDRPVAIKLPHAHRISRTEDIEAYRTEARTISRLNHSNIVPIYDVGSTATHPFFFVVQYIDGETLARRIQRGRPPLVESIQVILTLARALAFAHRHGIIHRDIKPGNILLDSTGKPYIADFGLALGEETLTPSGHLVGTPDYMSPEQARGESHRVNGSSDVFSLGIVFYELLTGKRPFRGNSKQEKLDNIIQLEVASPRQWDESIPREIERICLKALAKRSSDRYRTMIDFAGDLNAFLDKTIELDHSLLSLQPSMTTEANPTLQLPASPSGGGPTDSNNPSVLRIIPRGLRSFDAIDADFFLDLLPGPHNRDGLPASVGFWKQRIEETDPDQTFAVGLLYGPSGCGKSSLIKAGLLPRLKRTILPAYLEATRDETEIRLLRVLRKQCPDLLTEWDLITSLAAIRRRQYLPSGKKILIVIDQFEQWLHSHKEETNSELAQALRQCDGKNLQCILLIRDDFWLAITRFMQELEINLLQGENMAVADLFSLDHGKKVLQGFGVAFNRLPGNPAEMTTEQKIFLQQAVNGLAEDGKIVCVRLALFADLMKDKEWKETTLKGVGGIEGVGMAFLEETFNAKMANPQHRTHQASARAVLKTLLPDSGTQIKGHMRSYDQLLAVSEYSQSPRDFEDLLRILDREIRLITPTDLEGTQSYDLVGGRRKSADSDPTLRPTSNRYYQLTHDYLVPALRDWLTRKQKETAQGRAELLLVDCTAVWTARPKVRNLPSIGQYLQIRGLTEKKTWTLSQRTMMASASRYYISCIVLVLSSLLLLGLIGYELFARDQANKLVDKVLIAKTEDVAKIIQEMQLYRPWLNPILREAYNQAKTNQLWNKQLHASLALLPSDSEHFDFLYDRLLNAEDPEQLRLICDSLRKQNSNELFERLSRIVKENNNSRQCFIAACALASYTKENNDNPATLWEASAGVIVDQLLQRVQNNPSHYATLVDLLSPVKNSLCPSLGLIYRDKSRSERERGFATNILATYAADQPKFLAELLMDGDPGQYKIIFPVIQFHRQECLTIFSNEFTKPLNPDLPSADYRREVLAKRQANAAIALFNLGKPEVLWPILQFKEDPRVRSYLIHKLSPLGTDIRAIIHRLDHETDISIRRALILSLGQFGNNNLDKESLNNLVKKVKEMYQMNPDAGLHGAAEWLLQTWDEKTWIDEMNKKWAIDEENRRKKLICMRQSIDQEKERELHQWYVNTQGQTLVLLPGSVQFEMGTHKSENFRRLDEIQHTVLIDRSFFIASKPVTLGEYRSLTKTNFGDGDVNFTYRLDLPVNRIDWYMAAKYCNLLSRAENIDENEVCYEEDDKGQVIGLKRNYLHLTGYRLPTEAEMEYATRGGSLTSRYYGETEELLEHYAWYTNNSNYQLKPVGTKKPNEYGLFDVHGNVFVWCLDPYDKTYGIKGTPLVVDSEKSELMKKNPVNRVSRGGSYMNPAFIVRSGYRDDNEPDKTVIFNGFRLARTFKSVPINK